MKNLFKALSLVVVLSTNMVGQDTIIVDTFSVEALKIYLEEVNVRYPDIIFAQAVLESKNFTSDVFKDNHNLMGMKCAASRPYTHLGVSNRGHAVYASWRMSVLDYVIYQSCYTRGLKTEEEYLKFLGHSYATDPRYVEKLKSIMGQK